MHIGSQFATEGAFLIAFLVSQGLLTWALLLSRPMADCISTGYFHVLVLTAIYQVSGASSKQSTQTCEGGRRLHVRQEINWSPGKEAINQCATVPRKQTAAVPLFLFLRRGEDERRRLLFSTSTPSTFACSAPRAAGAAGTA